MAPVSVSDVDAATAGAPMLLQQQPRRVEQREQRTHKQGHWSEQRQKIQWGRVLQLCLRVAFSQYGASQQRLAPPKSTAPRLLTAGTSAGTCAAAAHASAPGAPDEELDAILPTRQSVRASSSKASHYPGCFPFVTLPFFFICHSPFPAAPSQSLRRRKHGCVGS